MCHHMAFPWYKGAGRERDTEREREREGATSVVSLLTRILILSDQGLTLMTSFQLSYFHRDHPPHPPFHI